MAEETSEITIRELESVEEFFDAHRVLSEVWEGDASGMPPNLLRALAHAGNYVVGLFDEGRLIGVSAGFFGPPAERTMHSHITGVLSDYRSRGLGRLLKEHQRQWAFQRDVGRITWTFDPLVARNAHFNLHVLGARVTEYLVDHYGPMDDGVNRGDASDRLMVSWSLAAPRHGNPDSRDVVATVPVPRDIERLRREEPAQAAAARVEVRESFQRLLGEGFVVGGFRDGPGYLFVTGERTR